MEFKCDECGVIFKPKKSDVKKETLEENESDFLNNHRKIFKNTFLTVKCPLCGSTNYLKKIESVYTGKTIKGL